MQNHPLVPIIRRYLLMAGLALLCLLWPEVALGVFPLMLLPNSCCCNACTIASDDFSSDTSANYTAVSGSFSIASGVMSTSSVSARIVANTAAPVGTTALIAKATITPSANTNSGWLLFAWTDATHYWSVSIQQGATNGTLSINQNGSSVASATITEYTTGGLTVGVCYARGKIVASAGGATATYTTTLTIAGTKVGVGTGAGSAISVTFDDLSFKKHRTDDTSCQTCAQAGIGGTVSCANCPDSSAPEEIQLTIAGLVNNVCTSCDIYNFTFVGGPTSECTYVFTPVQNTCSGSPGVSFSWGAGPVGTVVISYGFVLCSGPQATYSASVTDCFSEFSGITPTYSGTGCCDWSGSTASVSSL